MTELMPAPVSDIDTVLARHYAFASSDHLGQVLTRLDHFENLATDATICPGVSDVLTLDIIGVWDEFAIVAYKSGSNYDESETTDRTTDQSKDDESLRCSNSHV